jgi:hypothetical protein
MNAFVRIFIAPVGIGKRGPLFSASLDGEIIVASSTEPALSAARALISRGYNPASILEIWDLERDYARLRGKLGVMAKQTVRESETGNAPVFTKYRPFQNAVCGHAGKAKTMVQTFRATQTAPEPLASPVHHGEAAEP